MPIPVYFMIILLLQMAVVFAFYREEKYFALLIAGLVNLMALSIAALLEDSFHPSPFILLGLIILSGIVAYGLFFKGGFKKGLIVSCASNAVAFGMIAIIVKIFG